MTTRVVLACGHERILSRTRLEKFPTASGIRYGFPLRRKYVCLKCRTPQVVVEVAK